MCYLISAFIAGPGAEMQRLAELPKSIGFRALRPRGTALTAVEVFRAGSAPPYPFTQALPSADVPLDLPEAQLAALFPFLLSRHIADGFKRSYINAGRQISDLVGTPVLALVANDDGIDFACVLDHGAVQRVAALCGDLLLTFAGGTLTVQALRSGEDEPDDVMEPTDLSGIAQAVPGCTVVSQHTPFSEELHYIAAKEFSDFTGQPAGLIGLGDFDADTNLRAFEILAQR